MKLYKGIMLFEWDEIKNWEDVGFGPVIESHARIAEITANQEQKKGEVLGNTRDATRDDDLDWHPYFIRGDGIADRFDVRLKENTEREGEDKSANRGDEEEPAIL